MTDYGATQHAHQDVDEIDVDELDVDLDLLADDDEIPGEGELDPDDDYTEGATREWVESLPAEERPPAFRDDS
jgi:hypothetical protein